MAMRNDDGRSRNVSRLGVLQMNNVSNLSKLAVWNRCSVYPRVSFPREQTMFG